MQEDWIWKNYGRALLSPGSLESSNHPIYHERNLPSLTDKKLHYPFCADLGDKEVYYSESSFQPKWQLWIINPPNFIESIADGFAGLFKVNGNKIGIFYDEGTTQFPKNIYKIERYNPASTGFLKGEVNLFLAPEDFYTGSTFMGVGTELSNNFYEKNFPINSFKLAERDYTTKDPTVINPLLRKQINDNLTNYNHLIDHSTFQFVFCQETMFSANLRYLNLKKEGEEWLIKYILKVKATPAGTYYTFLSGNILWQLRIEIKQIFPSGQSLKNLLTLGMLTAVVTGAFVLAGAIGAGGAGLADGAILNSIGGDLRKIQKVNQLLKGAKSILPEENENISFSMSLFDFWSKLRERPFWGKIYVSNNLKNNLAHNNNENPITYPLNITFDKLWKVLKKGEYQGNLKLDYDPGKYLSTKFREGLAFFEDKSKDFITPELGLKQASSLITYNLANSKEYSSEEIREEEVVEVDRPKGNNFHQRVHYLIEYEDGTKEHWLALLPMFKDNELADGHTKTAFNLYFDKPVKFFWDVYTCIGCGASNEFNDLHPDYGYGSSSHGSTMPTDSWDTLYKDLPVEPWFGNIENTSSLKWCGKVMGGANDVWAGRKEQRPNGKSFTAAYGFIPTGGVIRWRLGSTGVKIQEIPQHDDFTGLDWQPPTGGTEDIKPTTSAFNYGESDIPDTHDVPEADRTPDIDVGTGGEPEITIDIETPDITPDTEVPDYDVPDIDAPDITPDVPETDPRDSEQPDQDRGDTDVPNVDDIPDSGDTD